MVVPLNYFEPRQMATMKLPSDSKLWVAQNVIYVAVGITALVLSSNVLDPSPTSIIIRAFIAVALFSSFADFAIERRSRRYRREAQQKVIGLQESEMSEREMHYIKKTSQEALYLAQSTLDETSVREAREHEGYSEYALMADALLAGTPVTSNPEFAALTGTLNALYDAFGQEPGVDSSWFVRRHQYGV